MNWHQRIAAARERGTFLARDTKLAGDWATCACGEQDPRIPRYAALDDSPAPLDDELENLGLDFLTAVEENSFDEAESVLARIEHRATEILAEATK